MVDSFFLDVIGGAMILMLSMFTGKTLACTSANKRVSACGGCLISPPWSMVCLSILYSLTFLFFVSNDIALAVTGQELMGTMYVLLQQGSSELV